MKEEIKEDRSREGAHTEGECGERQGEMNMGDGRVSGKQREMTNGADGQIGKTTEAVRQR